MAADESAVGYRAWSSTELTYFEDNLPAVKVQVQKSGVGTKKVKLQKVNAAKEALHPHVNGLPAVVADMLKTDTHKAESTYTAPQVADFVVDFTVVMMAVINSAVQLPPDVVNRIQAVTNITREAVAKRKGAMLAAASKLVLPGEATQQGWISAVQSGFNRTTPPNPDGIARHECPRCNHRSLVCIRGLSELAGENADRAAKLEEAQKVC